ncbi:hypothetical protein G6O69_28220 [Pseudenhygromyxa sp. WMMC2535]|uniref:hypothetical protein n=1 Tax=Pseudenhygromyxa sp. WMMC2535 TaxID=2712867 RepID=UPI00155164B3|nr:hypothetical protein [Pseudenhygromyxa sp. WMMC2535]NVB41753.1 hypothetical protein [Pseudenhygromyxa sp. WMMC2535]
MSKDEPEAEPELAASEEDEHDDQDDFAAPFEARSFGGEFVWAEGARYTCKVLRVRAGEKVLISTRGRSDMTVMLTGGRAVLEVVEADNAEIDRVELLPAAPVQISPEREHRLVALTEVELYTVYSPLESE